MLRQQTNSTEIELPEAWEKSLRKAIGLAEGDESKELPLEAILYAKKMYKIYSDIKKKIAPQKTEETEASKANLLENVGKKAEEELAERTRFHSTRSFSIKEETIAQGVEDKENKDTKEELTKNIKKKEEEELAEWQQLQALVDWIEKDNEPFDLQKINLLAVYTTDALLTMDARLEQKRMIWITGILYILGIAIMVACPLSTAAAIYTFGTGWGMAVMLTGILASKIEGIIAALATMKAGNEGACRRPFKDVNTVQAGLEKKRARLEPLQRLILDLKLCCEAAQAAIAPPAPPESKNLNAALSQQPKKSPLNALKNIKENIAVKTADLQTGAGNVWEGTKEAILKSIRNSESQIKKDLNELIAAMEELQKSPVPEEQAAWVQLLRCLTPLTQNPLDSEAWEALEKKSAELAGAADTRAKQNAAKKFAKIALYISLAITVTCITIIAIAMLGYGLPVTSSIVLTADTFILISKIMFWALGAGGTAAGVIDTNKWWQRLKKCCRCFHQESSHNTNNDKADASDIHHEKNEALGITTPVRAVLQEATLYEKKAPSPSFQTPLQKISIFAKKICTLAKEESLSNRSISPRVAAAAQ